MEHRVIIPQAVHSNYEGYKYLLEIAKTYMENDSETKIVLDFRANTWFDANLLAVIYAIVEFGRKNNIQSAYSNQKNCKLHKLLIRNGFGKHCFDLPYHPRSQETSIPFKVFLAIDTYNFSAYMDQELTRYFPNMDCYVKKAISSYIQELFGNAQIHGHCIKVYTCGQYYFANHKMDFTIVNLGKTFSDNVSEYLTELKTLLPVNSIAWAVEPYHSTKRNTTGGIGLSLMRDFINYNHGKFQIISGNEYWELSEGLENNLNFDCSFPGTIINIEIDQNDKNIYSYGDELFSTHELLF